VTRTKATPLSARLRSFLNEHAGEQRSFSAGSLAGEFEWTRGTLKATVGQIGKELKKAHAAGQVICFVDDRGLPLREAEHVAPGSKSNNHPVIYAMPGTPSPQGGYRPAAHDEVNRSAAADDTGDDDHDADEAAEEPVAEERPAAPDPRTRLRELKTAIACWRPDGPAPACLTDEVLARLVSLPAAQVMWRQGLTSSRHPADRLTLLNAGVRRKGDFPPTSGAAQAMAAACRRDVAWFGWLVTAVHEHLDKKGPAVPDGELAAFVDDPEGWALDHADAPVELVVMTGLMAGADEETLADVAEVMADEPRAPSATVEEQLRGRLQEAQAAKEELSRQLRDALREAEKAGKVAERLRGELDELAAGSEEAADTQALADRRAAELARAHERVAALEADLESAQEDAERAQEDAQAAAELPALREQLQTVREGLDGERRLRQAAEAREQDQAARARSLARDLQQESGRGLTLPVDDAGAVLGALAGPVGQAARAGRDAVERAFVLWADCDGDDAVAALEAFAPAPGIVICSGTGANCHAYWPLAEAIGREELERSNRRLAHALGADAASADAARILRVPGTLSHKHDRPTAVDAIRLDVGRELAVGDVVGLLPDPPRPSPPRSAATASVRRGDDPLLTIAPEDYVRRLLGVDVPRDRKVRCPFHEDRHASLHVYETAQRGWYCFGACRRGGTIYDLAAPLFGYAPRGEEFLRLRAELHRLFGIEAG